MVEALFFSPPPGVPLDLYIFVSLQQWAPLLLAGVAALAYFMTMRLFAFPLLTRNPSELVVILGANKAKIFRIVDKSLPFFETKNAAYWFDSGVDCGDNKLHVYVQNVNQPIHNLKRMQNKETDVFTYRDKVAPQVKPHNIIIPPFTKKIFTTSWVLVILPTGEARLVPTKESGIKAKMQYKIGLFRRLGVYQLATQEVPAESTSESASGGRLQSVTVESVLQQVGDIKQYTNFSSVVASALIRRIRRDEKNIVRRLTGGMDPKIMIILLAMVGMIGMVIIMFMVFKPDIGSLPPPPPEVQQYLKGGH